MTYSAAGDRYDTMTYRRAGRSGLQAARDLPGPVAQLRPRPPAGNPAARHRPARLRPRRHPLRPGQQLRPAARQRRGELRPDARRRPAAVPRRAGHLHQGRLPHVARPVRRVGLPQIPGRRRWTSRCSRHGPGLRRHLLPPPPRPGHPARGDDGRPRRGRPRRQGALRRHQQLHRRADRAGRRDPARPGHAAADPPAVVLDAQPLDRDRTTCSTPSKRSAPAASRSARCSRACSPTATSTASPPTRGSRTSVFLNESALDNQTMGRMHALNDIAQRPRPVPRPAGPRLGAARPADDQPDHRRSPASPSWRTTSPPWTTSTFTEADLDEIDGTVLDL